MSSESGAAFPPAERASSLGARSLRHVEALSALPFSWRIGAIVLVFAAALGCRMALVDVLGERFGYITFYPAILTAAVLCGYKGGFLTAALAMVVAHVRLGGLLIASFDQPRDVFALGGFVFISSVMILMAGMLRNLAQARRDSEDLIRLNAEQLGHFVEQAPPAMAMFDRDMRYIAASARWREDHGLARDVVGKSHYDVFPELTAGWKDIHKRVLDGEILRSEEDEYVRQDGSTQWLRWEARPWRHPRDGVGGVIIFSEDISERVRAREALAESDLRMHFALHAAKAGAWEWDLESNTNSWSDELWRLFRLAPNSCEPSYDAWMATIHPDDRAAVARDLADATSKGKELKVEWRTLDATGAERWLMLRGGPWRKAEGALSCFLGIVIDITERRRAEQAMRDNERRLNAIVDTAMEAIVSIDRSGAIQSANPAACEMFGHELDQILGRNVKMLMSDRYSGEHDSYLANYLATGEKKIIGLRRRVEGRRREGAVFPVELTVSEATSVQDPIFVGFMRDLGPIEEERRRVNALRAELFHVSRLNDMGEVVASLAHEVGQPIAAILNFSAAHRRAMEATGEAPEPALIAKIEAQARRAADILKRLRGFIEKRPPERRPEKIQDMIDEAIKLAFMRSRAVVNHVAPPEAETDICVRVDRILIEQVLVNLLRNADDALVDTPAPGIWVETCAIDPAKVRVSIADNGPGVDQETLSEIFSPFFGGKKLGMGVGLSISRTIVESHGGVLSYRPNAPRGSIFEFTLPICRVGDEAAATDEE